MIDPLLRRLVRAFALLAVTIAPAGHADQTDPELPSLFSALADAPNPVVASGIERQIWSRWMRGPEPAANTLLDEARDAASSGAADEARGLFEQLLERFPEFAEGWNQRAILHYFEGDYQRSLEDIARTLELEPRHFGALAGSGQCYFRLEMYEEALAAFEAALQVHPWLHAARQQVEMLKSYLNARPRPI